MFGLKKLYEHVLVQCDSCCFGIHKVLPVSVPHDASLVSTASHHNAEWLARHHTVDRAIMAAQVNCLTTVT